MLWTDRERYVSLPFSLSLWFGSVSLSTITLYDGIVGKNITTHADMECKTMHDACSPSHKNRDWRAGFKRRGERRRSMLVGWFDGSASASGFLNAYRYACVGVYAVFLVRCLCVKRGIIKMIYAANCFGAADEMVCDICGTWE